MIYLESFLNATIPYLRELPAYFISGFVGACVALWLNGLKKPALTMMVGEQANDENVYRPPHKHANERWKFFRVLVYNKGLWFPLNLIANRETAENCSAKVTFFKSNSKSPLFSMKGRWASTPEIPHTGPLAIIKTFHPDPVTIPALTSIEFLDIITQMDGEPCAYAWNAESYGYDWRHPERKLDPGTYKVRVSIFTQNGISFSRNFILRVSTDIKKTYIKKD